MGRAGAAGGLMSVGADFAFLSTGLVSVAASTFRLARAFFAFLSLTSWPIASDGFCVANTAAATNSAQAARLLRRFMSGTPRRLRRRPRLLCWGMEHPAIAKVPLVIDTPRRSQRGRRRSFDRLLTAAMARWYSLISFS